MNPQNTFIERIRSTTNVRTEIIQRDGRLSRCEIIGIEINKKTSVSDYGDFKLEIGGNIICCIPLNIFAKLSKKMYENDSQYISIEPQQIFIYDLLPTIPLYDLPFHQTFIVLTSNTDIDFILHLRHTEIDILQYKNRATDGEIQEIKTLCHEQLNSVSEIIIPFNERKFNSCGVLIETTEINDLTIIVNNEYRIKKHNKKILDVHKIHKNKWTKYKSHIFNIVMEKILPYEMINCIEEFIADTYLYYIPIDLGNYYRKFQRNNSGDKSIIIKFGDKVTGDIHYLYYNEIMFMHGVCGLCSSYEIK